jgi:hypothetical protein
MCIKKYFKKHSGYKIYNIHILQILIKVNTVADFKAELLIEKRLSKFFGEVPTNYNHDIF